MALPIAKKYNASSLFSALFGVTDRFPRATTDIVERRHARRGLQSGSVPRADGEGAGIHRFRGVRRLGRSTPRPLPGPQVEIPAEPFALRECREGRLQVPQMRLFREPDSPLGDAEQQERL